MNKIKIFYLKYKQLIPIILGAFILLFLLIFRLSSLLGGMSQSEIRSINSSSNINNIINNGLNDPYNFLQFLVHQFASTSIFGFRLVSVILTIPVLIFFFIHLRHRYGKYTAPMATILLGSSAWVLHSSRTATPDILLIYIIGLLWYYSYLRSSKNYTRILLFGIILLSVLFYVPGLIWFIALFIYWQRHILKALISKVDKNQAIGFYALGTILLIPLIFGLIITPRNIVTFLGLPSSSPNLLISAKTFILIPYNLFIRMPYNPAQWLTRVPVLDAFSSGLFIIGIFILIKEWKSNYSKGLIVSFVLGAILYSLGGPVSLSVLIPTTYLIIASGLGYIIDEWFRVFPRNPISRFFGISILSIAILCVFIYQTRNYFIAWPNSSYVKSYYRQYPS
jgi:hypothetical protein